MVGFSMWHMIILLVGLAFGVVWLIGLGNIVKKAGYNPWLALLYLVPLVNIVCFFIFAFGRWPNEPTDAT